MHQMAKQSRPNNASVYANVVSVVLNCRKLDKQLPYLLICLISTHKFNRRSFDDPHTNVIT